MVLRGDLFAPFDPISITQTPDSRSFRTVARNASTRTINPQCWQHKYPSQLLPLCYARRKDGDCIIPKGVFSSVAVHVHQCSRPEQTDLELEQRRLPEAAWGGQWFAFSDVGLHDPVIYFYKHIYHLPASQPARERVEFALCTLGPRRFRISSPPLGGGNRSLATSETEDTRKTMRKHLLIPTPPKRLPRREIGPATSSTARLKESLLARNNRSHAKHPSPTFPSCYYLLLPPVIEWFWEKRRV